MNKRKLFVLTFLALVLLLGTLTVEGASQESHPTFNVTFTYTRLSTLDPGRVWTDEYGIWHVRDRIDYGLIDGDIQGSAIVVYNADLAGGSAAEPPDNGGAILPPDGRDFGAMSIISWWEIPLWTGDWRQRIVNGKVGDGEMAAFNADQTRFMNISSVVEGVIEGGSPSLIHTGTIDRVCFDLYQLYGKVAPELFDRDTATCSLALSQEKNHEMQDHNSHYCDHNAAGLFRRSLSQSGGK